MSTQVPQTQAANDPALVSSIERHLFQVTGYLPYDIVVGLTENTCLGNFNALARSIEAGNKATADTIYQFVKRRYRLDHLIVTWDRALSDKVHLVPSLIYQVVSKYYRDAFLAPASPVRLSVVLLSLVWSTFGNPPVDPSVQTFGTALLESISLKKGPELTEYLMRQNVSALLIIFRSFRFAVDKDLGTEVLDILSVTKKDDFQAYTFSKTAKSNMNLFNDLCLFGHYVCASLVPGDFVQSSDSSDSSSSAGSLDESAPVTHEPVVLRSGRKVERKKANPTCLPRGRGRPGRLHPYK